MTVASRALQSPVGLCDAKGPGEASMLRDPSSKASHQVPHILACFCYCSCGEIDRMDIVHWNWEAAAMKLQGAVMRGGRLHNSLVWQTCVCLCNFDDDIVTSHERLSAEDLQKFVHVDIKFMRLRTMMAW